MFSFDFPEIVIIFGVALVVLGPKKLPGTVQQIGRWVGRARAMARQFRDQLEQEVNSVESALDTSRKPDTAISDPLKREVKAPEQTVPSDTSTVPGYHAAPAETTQQSSSAGAARDNPLHDTGVPHAAPEVPWDPSPGPTAQPAPDAPVKTAAEHESR
jgi:sec-independent protein translocase protein TatB